MATVRFLFTKPDATGAAVPIDGTLTFSPTKRVVLTGSPDMLVLPVPFVVNLGKDGAADVELAPTGVDWAWAVEINLKGVSRFTRYVSVPDVPTIDFTNLTFVDKATLSPTAEPVAAWYTYVDGLQLVANTSLEAVVISRDAALAAQDAATGAQDSAATSASLAAASANAADASADTAGTSAFNAGQSAAIALGHRNDSEDFATSASSSATAAAASETAAGASADAAANSRTASEVARDAAQAAKTASEGILTDTTLAATGFDIGTVTTGDPGEDAAATITGTAPNRLLNLDLPRGLTGPANSLSVGTVTTLQTGQPAAVRITGTAPAQVVDIDLPAGQQGSPGDMVSVAGPAPVSGAVSITEAMLPSTRIWTLTGNTTITLATPSAGSKSGTITLVLTQDGTGGRTITWPASTVLKWPDGIAQQPATAANSVSVIHLLWTGVQWLGLLGGKSFA